MNVIYRDKPVAMDLLIAYCKQQDLALLKGVFVLHIKNKINSFSFYISFFKTKKIFIMLQINHMKVLILLLEKYSKLSKHY